MLRLTLRSGRDGRFLARVIDRSIGAFVLDYGDPATIAEASELALRGGFRAWMGGRYETASSQDPHMLLLLAHHFASQGHLVFLDEPAWPGRRETIEERLPRWLDPTDSPDPTDDTALISGEGPRSAQLGPVPLDTIRDIDEDDVSTEQVELDTDGETQLDVPRRR